MGSLPNLHELSKECEEDALNAAYYYKPGPALGHLCGGCQTQLSDEEKSKIIHRYSGHARITKARSNGNDSKVIYDDFMMAHMAAYSPVSSRSARNLAHHQCTSSNIIHATSTIRRRDSMNSSIGATSVRRLIAVVRSGGGGGRDAGSSSQHHFSSSSSGHHRDNGGQPYSRRLLLSNLLVFCLSHLLITAAFLPFLALQTSVSVWTVHYDDNSLRPININIGSILLAIVHLCACVSSLVGPSLVQKLGTNVVFIASYMVFVVFYLAHLYPTLYLLLPVSILLGLVLGPLASARTTFLMTLSMKISYMFASLSSTCEDEDDSKELRRTCVIRRLARACQGAHDFGLIVGSVLSALLITYTVNINHVYGSGDFLLFNNITDNTNNSTILLVNSVPIDYNNSCAMSNNNSQYGRVSTNCVSSSPSNNNDNNLLMTTSPIVYDYNAFLDDIFDTFEGSRLCGAQACPPDFYLNFDTNMSSTGSGDYFYVLPHTTVTVLALVYGALCFLATMIGAGGLDRLRMYVYQDPLERPEGLAALRAVRESFRDVRLQMAAPLAVFIGLEQAFMYADFSKSYVVCTLGIHRLNLVFLSMGVLQSIAACTLSMLLRTIRRYYVVAVGFTFHACLLMVLILWKPIEDDPALFYVISAAWGVCNAIWEMLNFTLLTGLYADNWEAAFANMAFWRFVGFFVTFAFHGVLCNYYKLYALGFFMVVSVIPFAWLEIRLENMRKVKNMTRL